MWRFPKVRHLHLVKLQTNLHRKPQPVGLAQLPTPVVDWVPLTSPRDCVLGLRLRARASEPNATCFLFQTWVYVSFGFPSRGLQAPPDRKVRQTAVARPFFVRDGVSYPILWCTGGSTSSPFTRGGLLSTVACADTPSLPCRMEIPKLTLKYLY